MSWMLFPAPAPHPSLTSPPSLPPPLLPHLIYPTPRRCCSAGRHQRVPAWPRRKASEKTQGCPFPRPHPAPALLGWIPRSLTDQHWPEEPGDPLHSPGHPHLSEDEEEGDCCFQRDFY